jgi:hypothetical protein
MNRTSWLVALAVFAFGLSIVRAEDTYTIKLKPPSKGDVGQVTKEDTEDDSFSVVVDGKVVQQKKNSKKETAKYKEEVLEKEKGKRPSSLRRTYDKAVATEDGKEKELPYSGKTLLIEKKGDKYTFRIDKGDVLKDEEVPSLVKEFKKDEDEEKMQELFLPKKAVAVNDSWNIDKDALKELFGKADESGIKYDVDNATATGKLLKAYKNKDKQYGVIEYNVTVPLASIQDNNFEKGSKVTMKLTVDVCIDGTEDARTVKGEFTMAGKFTQQGATVQVEGTGVTTEKREEAKK